VAHAIDEQQRLMVRHPQNLRRIEQRTAGLGQALLRLVLDQCRVAL
jgi:hypothetical protein